MSTLKERNAERLRKSIAREKADGHAVFNYYTYPFFHAVSKVPLNEYFHNPKVMFETQLEVLEQLDGCGNLAPRRRRRGRVQRPGRQGPFRRARLHFGGPRRD